MLLKRAAIVFSVVALVVAEPQFGIAETGAQTLHDEAKASNCTTDLDACVRILVAENVTFMRECSAIFPASKGEFDTALKSWSVLKLPIPGLTEALDDKSVIRSQLLASIRPYLRRIPDEEREIECSGRLEMLKSKTPRLAGDAVRLPEDALRKYTGDSRPPDDTQASTRSVLTDLPRIKWPDYSVSIEVCFPNSTDAQDHNIYASEIGEHSAASNMTLNVGATARNQPVYRSELSSFERDKAAVIHVKDGDGNYRSYVVAIPLQNKLELGTWSEWLMPDYQSNTRNPDLEVLGSSKVAAFGSAHPLQLDGDTPRFRYLLQPFKGNTQWIVDRRVKGQESGLAPCTS